MTSVLIIVTGRTVDAGPTAALPCGSSGEAPILLTRLRQRLDTLNVPGCSGGRPAVTRPHTRPMNWLVPTIIRRIEYGYLAVLGFAQGVSAPLVYGLIAVLAFHHHDTVYRSRLGLRSQAWALRAGLGWEGRMLLVALAGRYGLLSFAYAALAAYLGVLFVCEGVTTGARTGHDDGVM